MALGFFDALCARCNARLGTHTVYGSEISGRYYCCPTKNAAGHWHHLSKQRFLDSGKKRSTYCDQRNNIGLYIF